MQTDTQRMAARSQGHQEGYKETNRRLPHLTFFLYIFDAIVRAASGDGGFPQKSPNVGGSLREVQKSPFRKIKVTEKNEIPSF